jgi:phage recombination protein Bet
MEGTESTPEGRSSIMTSSITTPTQPARGLSREQVELIKATIARGASDAELHNFVQVCNRLGLDPFAKQIYFIRRGNVAQPQVSIDGFRVVAERTREYRGQTTPQWCGRDGEWRDVWLANEPPAAARVGVWRDGFREPLVRTALFRSYAQQSPLWRNMPEVMLLKCAEAQALRAAFPNELGGVYTTDEMDQAGGNPPPPQPEPFPLAQLEPPREAAQEAAWEPAEPEERSGVVVPFKAPQAPASALERMLAGSVVAQPLVAQLRGAKTAEELVGWMREVRALELSRETKQALWAEFSRRAHSLRLDPDVLLAKAKGGA